MAMSLLLQAPETNQYSRGTLKENGKTKLLHRPIRPTIRPKIINSMNVFEFIFHLCYYFKMKWNQIIPPFSADHMKLIDRWQTELWELPSNKLFSTFTVINCSSSQWGGVLPEQGSVISSTGNCLIICKTVMLHRRGWLQWLLCWHTRRNWSTAAVNEWYTTISLYKWMANLPFYVRDSTRVSHHWGNSFFLA